MEEGTPAEPKAVAERQGVVLRAKEGRERQLSPASAAERRPSLFTQNTMPLRTEGNLH